MWPARLVVPRPAAVPGLVLLPLLAAILMAAFQPGPARAETVIVAGKRLSCSAARIVTSHRSPVAGYATPGLIVLNPKRLGRYPGITQRLIFLHECAHQYVGRDETAADCWAVRQGRRQGWLTSDGIEATCRAIRHLPGSDVHLPGPSRCLMMRRCFADAATPARHASSD